MQEDSSLAAWTAYQAQNYDLAAELWLAQMAEAPDVETHCRCQLAYAQVLLARKQYAEALAILEELYDNTQHPDCLHLMAIAARESGATQQARRHLLNEQRRRAENNALALANNAYELALVAILENLPEEALGHAHASLAAARGITAPSLENRALRLIEQLGQEPGPTDTGPDLRGLQAGTDVSQIASKEAIPHGAPPENAELVET